MTGTDVCVNKPHCAAFMVIMAIMVTKKKSVPVIFEPPCTNFLQLKIASSLLNILKYIWHRIIPTCTDGSDQTRYTTKEPKQHEGSLKQKSELGSEVAM
jgi:hypothetical protein